MAKPLVAILMGSHSDWELMKHAADTLDNLAIPHEARVISAHRAPDALHEFIVEAEKEGVEVFITGAGMAAALPGVVAAQTTLPVLGVPLPGSAMQGLDALMSIVQMPAGVPVGTLAVGRSGAINAALLAAAILGRRHVDIRERYAAFRKKQTDDAVSRQVPGGQ
ncbi:MAG: 5-(carboxyamino)imidazole ribonucleotide mutase [Phycisphaerales bacterium]|nr:5-(carboxyamino)imidazole ribonucleotide mutase [Phycisphaerales bacterium]